MKKRNIDEYLTNFRKLTNEICTKNVIVDDFFKYFLLKVLGKIGQSNSTDRERGSGFGEEPNG